MNPIQLSPRSRAWGVASLSLLAAVTVTGCARPQPTAEQVAAIHAPLNLHVGANPPGGPSESSTGSGAGGSAAAGYEAGRVSGPRALPTVPPQPQGITYSRMSPVGSSGSGLGDRGNPIPPEQPLVPANANGVTQPITPNPQQTPPNLKTGSP